MKFIVCNDKGGVGKSTIAQFVAINALLQKTTNLKIVEFDGQPKLLRILGPKRVESRPITGTGAIGAPFETRNHVWDDMLEWLTDDSYLIADFGAQAWGEFYSWAQELSLDQFTGEQPVTLIIPVTADIEAINAAERIVQQAGRILPKADIKVLTLDKDGPVSALTKLPPMQQLTKSITQHKATLLQGPIMPADEYSMISAYGLNFGQILRSEPRKLAKGIGLSIAQASRATRTVKKWFSEMRLLLAPIQEAKPAEKQIEKTAAPTKEPASSSQSSSVDKSTTPAVTAEATKKPTTTAKPAPAAKTLKETSKTKELPPPSWFDENQYLELHKDVKEAVKKGTYQTGYAHYEIHGRFEGRRYK